MRHAIYIPGRQGLALLAALSLAACATQPVEGDRSTLEPLRAIPAEEIEEFVRGADGYWYGPFPEDEIDPAAVLAGMLEDDVPLVEAAMATGRRFHLSDSLSADLAFGLVVTPHLFDLDELDPDRIAAATEAFYRVLAARPRITGVWGRLVGLIEVGHPDCADPRFLDTLFAQGAEYALKVHDLNYCGQILARAVAERPFDSDALDALQNAFGQSQATRIVLAERWREALLAEGVTAPDLRLRRAGTTLLWALVDAGLAEEAVAFAAEAPFILSPPASGVEAGEVGVQYKSALWEYLVALLATDRNVEAREYLPYVRQYEACPEDRQSGCHGWTALRILIERGDAFDLLKAVIEADVTPGILFTQLLIDYFAASGYPDLAADYHEQLANMVSYVVGLEDDSPEVFDAFGSSFLERRAHYAALIEARLPVLPVSVVAKHSFSQPHTRTLFEETEFAASGVAPACRSLEPDSVAAMTEQLDIWPVRVQECGDALVLLGTSQSLDPVGEISPGAYWLAISTDRGQTWRETYTGLRIYFPYVARAESDIPLLYDGKVLIHADLLELDVRSITFPPVGLEPLRERRDLVLAAKLADLQRDSDEDGLTDLVEDRLLLDGNNPDFDGDGILDGYDMQPNVPAGERTEKGEAFALVLEQVFGYERAAIIPGIIEPADTEAELLRQAMAPGPPLRASDTQFVVADPELFKGQLLPFRPIVLTPGQAQELEDELGIFLPLRLDGMRFSKDEDRALIQWSARWTGGTIYLERDASGHWQADSLSRWIT